MYRGDPGQVFFFIEKGKVLMRQFQFAHFQGITLDYKLSSYNFFQLLGRLIKLESTWSSSSPFLLLQMC